MVPDELGKQLHDRATRGEALSPEEQAQLENWYATQDRAEADQLGLTATTETVASLQTQLEHFLELDDGTLYPLTATGAFTLRRLRLNRPPLVDHRLRKCLLTRYRDLVKVLEQLLTQKSVLMEEQQELLKEQRQLLQLLLGDRR